MGHLHVSLLPDGLPGRDHHLRLPLVSHHYLHPWRLCRCANLSQLCSTSASYRSCFSDSRPPALTPNPPAGSFLAYLGAAALLGQYFWAQSLSLRAVVMPWVKVLAPVLGPLLALALMWTLGLLPSLALLAVLSLAAALIGLLALLVTFGGCCRRAERMVVAAACVSCRACSMPAALHLRTPSHSAGCGQDNRLRKAAWWLLLTPCMVLHLCGYLQTTTLGELAVRGLPSMPGVPDRLGLFGTRARSHAASQRQRTHGASCLYVLLQAGWASLTRCTCTT